jgi:hypothetical protein
MSLQKIFEKIGPFLVLLLLLFTLWLIASLVQEVSSKGQEYTSSAETEHRPAELWTIERTEGGAYRAEKQSHEESISDERLIAWGTIALVLATFGLFGATAYLARSTQHLADEARAQGKVLSDSIVEARRAADAAKASAEATVEANTIARETAEADRRPWVAVDIALAGPLRWTDDGARMLFRFTLSNVGRAPAFQAFVHAKMITFFGDPRAAQREFCEPTRNQAAGFGITIFPGQGLPVTHDLVIGNADIDLQEQNVRRDFPEGPEPTFGRWLMPMLVGCVNYRFEWDGPIHQTGFIATIRRAVPLNDSFVISREIGDVPVNELAFERFIFDGRTD